MEATFSQSAAHLSPADPPEPRAYPHYPMRPQRAARPTFFLVEEDERAAGTQQQEAPSFVVPAARS